MTVVSKLVNWLYKRWKSRGVVASKELTYNLYIDISDDHIANILCEIITVRGTAANLYLIINPSVKVKKTIINSTQVAKWKFGPFLVLSLKGVKIDQEIHAKILYSYQFDEKFVVKPESIIVPTTSGVFSPHFVTLYWLNVSDHNLLFDRSTDEIAGVMSVSRYISNMPTPTLIECSGFVRYCSSFQYRDIKMYIPGSVYSFTISKSIDKYARKIIAALCRIFNCEYPETLSIVFDEFANATSSGFNLLLPLEKYQNVIQLNEKEMTDWVMGLSHEISHYYWGNVLMSDMFATPWIHEGLAEYSAYRITAEILGIHAVKEVIDHRADLVHSHRHKLAPVSETTLLDKNLWLLAYCKSSLALWELSEQVGADRVNSALGCMLKKYANILIDCNDLINAMNKLNSEATKTYKDMITK
ncbi:hypothetical protein CSA37_00295 [Candidatus Fermentibacteria bacterium]|nr:MAG: hypothetical protein CSA37_00295 [Candidatus Fermentibacteria bacterium]